MESYARRPRALQDQENTHALKNKQVSLLPSKKPGQTVRGALGELNTNVQQGQVNVGKVTADFEKKSLRTRSTYSHVQSKVDTGLNAKCQIPSKPVLKREESTAGLARAAIRTQMVPKDNNLPKTIDKVCVSNIQNNLPKTIDKECVSNIQLRKKEITKLPCSKERELRKPKAVTNEPIESMRTLKREIEILDASLPLPDDIADIDADRSNILLMTEYVKDIYRYLRELEIKYEIEENFLKNHTEITEKMRSTLINWLVEVHCQFSLLHETFHLAVGIIDRYLQQVPTLMRSKLQLVGVTALYMASKYEEVYPPEADDFIYVTDNSYTKKELFAFEREMFFKMGYSLARPIPLSFLRRFIKATIDGKVKHHQLAKYLVDLSLVQCSMAHHRPSKLAAAAICLSLYLLSSKSPKDIWTPTMCYYTGYTLVQIEPVVKNMAKLVLNVEKSNFKAVYNKYLDVKLSKVASLPNLNLKCMAISELPSLT